MAGYCTPNGQVGDCEVATNADGSAEAPLAPGAYRSVGYDLCSFASVEQQYTCGPNNMEGVLDAQAFSSPDAAHAYLQSQAGQQWVMGWQLNQWVLLVTSAGGGLPPEEQAKIEKALTSAATINNGSPLSGTSALVDLRQVF
jgi:hypothetical protein